MKEDCFAFEYALGRLRSDPDLLMLAVDLARADTRFRRNVTTAHVYAWVKRGLFSNVYSRLVKATIEGNTDEVVLRLQEAEATRNGGMIRELSIMRDRF